MDNKSVIDLVIEKIIESTIEKCAVVAWNHYMDVCKKNNISPATFNEWCASSKIRELKGGTNENIDNQSIN